MINEVSCMTGGLAHLARVDECAMYEQRLRPPTLFYRGHFVRKKACVRSRLHLLTLGSNLLPLLQGIFR